MACDHTAAYAAEQSKRLSGWAELCRRREESGMTVRRFCESNSVSVSRYQYWRRKLRDEQAAGKEPQERAPAGWRLVDTRGAANAAAGGGGEITVEFGGYVVRAGANADAAFLALACRELRRIC